MADVKLTLPENMTAEQFQKLVGTFLKSRQAGQVVGKAQGKAIKDLKAAHKSEYDALVAKYTPKT